MKKLLMVLVALVAVVSLAACKGKEYKLGMGVVVSTASTKAGNAQVDATVAAVVTDSEGKIVAARIDVAQNKVKVSEAGVLTVPEKFETKMELGSRYGMAGKVDNDENGTMLEWDAQTKAFEEHVIGMTGAEVAAMETVEAKGHQISTDADLLAAGCSMQITDFMAAVAAACADEQGVTFKAKKFTLGVAANSYNSGSTDASADKAGAVQVYTDFGAAVVADGKIVAALNDCIQPKIAVAADGTLTPSYKNTKRVLKGEYGMAGKVDNDENGTMLEWFEQSAAFSAHVVGMTAEEVAAMETVEAKGHQISTDADLLAAGCSMEITGLKAAVAKAATNAR